MMPADLSRVLYPGHSWYKLTFEHDEAPAIWTGQALNESAAETLGRAALARKIVGFSQAGACLVQCEVLESWRPSL